MKPPDEKATGLKPVTIAIAMGASVGVWLIVEVLRKVLS